MRLAAVLLAVISFLVGGCAMKPPPEVVRVEMCEFDRYLLQTKVPDDPETLLSEPLSRNFKGSFEDALRQVYRDRPKSGSMSQSILLLSGGSQNGAFGAGFLDGWSKLRKEEGKQCLPSCRVVTGVSTGAILSTWAFINDTATLTRNYHIRRETDVLQPFADPRSDFSLAMAIARRGALGDLVPLRRQLRRELTHDVLLAVAGARDQGRRLYVGAVDVDMGEAVAFDMTEMAVKYRNNPKRREHYRDCYADAIVASSAVPSAALPVFIDNRLYIDGGARFGIFSDQLGPLIKDQRSLVGQPPFYYVIVNGELRVAPECQKETGCTDGRSGGLEGRRKPWRFHELAMRSAEILISQIYLDSVERLVREAEGENSFAKVDFIRPAAQDHESEVQNPELGTGKERCSTWRAIDEEKDHPLEFHPRYMHCLISYGAHRAKIQEWYKDPD